MQWMRHSFDATHPVTRRNMFTESIRSAWLPRRVNEGTWLSHYTVEELETSIRHQRIFLPICSLTTPPEQIERLGPLVLPPLFTEALDLNLKSSILSRIEACFPFYEGSRRREQADTTIDIVELPLTRLQRPVPAPRILAFSVDPAVEQHGPHL